MKKWIITAAIVLASATVANAGWTRCETVRIFPGFSIRQCETVNRYEHRDQYRSQFNKGGHKYGHRHNIFARNHSRYDRYYDGRKGYPPWNRYTHDRRYRRDHYRW
jgi:hypothetical protein